MRNSIKTAAANAAEAVEAATAAALADEGTDKGELLSSALANKQHGSKKRRYQSSTEIRQLASSVDGPEPASHVSADAAPSINPSALSMLAASGMHAPISPLTPGSAVRHDSLSQSQLMQPVIPNMRSSLHSQSTDQPAAQLHSPESAVNPQQQLSQQGLPASIANPTEQQTMHAPQSTPSTKQQQQQQGKLQPDSQPAANGSLPGGLVINTSHRWRTLPPLSGSKPAQAPNQNRPSSLSMSSADPHHHQPSIHDILGGTPIPPASEMPSIESPHATAHRTDRSNSLTGSLSSVGSPMSSSPAFVGVDPKQLEAALPSPAPDTLDNMLKAFFKYQYPSSGIVQEEFFWYRYRRNMLTPLIIYSMLAVATWNLASEVGGEKYMNLHEMFYRNAKQFVEDAMDEAHLRSVQGLLILAQYEALVGRWATMWAHTTMARRLAEGIIFRDTDFPWPGVQQKEFDFEFQRVQRAYWHSFINDIMSTVLMDKQIGGIEIAVPPKPSYDFTYRSISLQDSDGPPGYKVLLAPDALQDPRQGMTASIGELFLLLGQINNCVYLFEHAERVPSFEAFIDFEMRLTNWCLNLRENVRLDDATIARFTSTDQRADLGEVIYVHLFWNFARLLLMKMGLVLSIKEDPSKLRNIYDTKAFYNTDSRALQFYQSSMPILTPDKAASYDEWLFHFCRCMSLQSAQNVVNLLKLGESHNVHPGHFGPGLNLPLIQVISVSLGLVRSPDPQVIRIAVDHLVTILRTLLRAKHYFNTAHLLLHLFLAMQDPQLVLPKCSYVSAEDSTINEAPENIRIYKAIEVTCPFPPSHLITELMRRLNITFEEFVKETIRAVRISSPSKTHIDPCITPLLKHLPEASQFAQAAVDQEPGWFRYAPSYLRSAWKRLSRTYKSCNRVDDGSAAANDANGAGTSAPLRSVFTQAASTGNESPDT